SRDVEAADEQSVRLPDRYERERHRREKEVAQVVLRQKRILMHRGIRSQSDDERCHQHERHPAAEGVHTICRPMREPTIASTMRRSPSCSPRISSTILPRDITTTRSQSPPSSSGSLDLTMIATPS